MVMEGSLLVQHVEQPLVLDLDGDEGTALCSRRLAVQVCNWCLHCSVAAKHTGGETFEFGIKIYSYPCMLIKLETSICMASSQSKGQR